MKSYILNSILFFVVAAPCISQNNKTLQDSLSFELCQLFAADQSIRELKLDKEIIIATKKLDSINFNKAISFIRQNGFPNEKLLGENFYSQECVQAACTVVLLHNPRRAIEPDVYSLLKNEVEEKRLSPITLSYILDRYYVSYKGISLYNSPYKVNTNAKGVRLEDKQESDRLRKDIGLEPLPESEFVSKIEKK